MADKRAMRARLRAVRDAFVADHPSPIVAPSALLRLLKPGLVVAGYSPVGSEADPALLVATVIDAGCTLALPHVVDRDRPMRFLQWHPDHPLDDGPFGLRQPHHEKMEMAPDIILTPLVGFDAALNRLGQGAGHYDRAFAALPHATRIGIAWSVQRVDTLPMDPWDVPLHAIITETGWIEGTTR